MSVASSILFNLLPLDFLVESTPVFCANTPVAMLQMIIVNIKRFKSDIFRPGIYSYFLKLKVNHFEII